MRNGSTLTRDETGQNAQFFGGTLYSLSCVSIVTLTLAMESNMAAAAAAALEDDG
ncbi:MAG TPA: hypothetical protein VFI97_08600 [Arthrobacter sp.]|jgi:hypothetical protein|nr:hypothetical protein [Arthrobacter sp.]